ncbi:unnamed protein product [Mycena citricolor]|uniref:Uncharacterized protein n=1 Tax=Mycena citricolor TaxID=2018698 RepID=A0AAD2HHB5_9AGAR|nr:unnamed protein product [Mycena citricolor]CAK5276284.1 unnamed protein product [Mycena citricolor]
MQTTARDLPSLAEWSRVHITSTFTAPTHELTLAALDQTFSRSLKATVNGKPVDFHGFGRMIAAMSGQGKNGGPHVEWVSAYEEDEQDGGRSGTVRAEYIVRDTIGTMPGSKVPMELEVHKKVIARIESQSTRRNLDSRRIVKLLASTKMIPVNPSLKSHL